MSTDTTSTPPSDAAGDADADLTAAEVAWDLETLIEGTDVDALLDRSDELTDELESYRLPRRRARRR